MLRKNVWANALNRASHVLYHLSVIVISAGIAMLLPLFVGAAARGLLAYWSLVENEKIFLMATEIGFAMLLIVATDSVRRNWQARRLARIAKVAGLARAFPGRGPLVLRKIRRLKEKHGAARDVWIIGSTGARTFADPGGELHEVLKRCRSARIMLLNPSSEGARTRVKSILAPEVTLDQFRDQIIRSLDFLRGLKGAQKTIRLKLYEDAPFLKLAILGDHAWVKLYHPGLDVQAMPEYAFEHDQNPGSLHTALYQYFLRAWESAPEYDLETDEVVYRDRRGRELKRVPFGEPVPPSGADVAGAVD